MVNELHLTDCLSHSLLSTVRDDNFTLLILCAFIHTAQLTRVFTQTLVQTLQDGSVQSVAFCTKVNMTKIGEFVYGGNFAKLEQICLFPFLACEKQTTDFLVL